MAISSALSSSRDFQDARKQGRIDGGLLGRRLFLRRSLGAGALDGQQATSSQGLRDGPDVWHGGIVSHQGLAGLAPFRPCSAVELCGVAPAVDDHDRRRSADFAAFGRAAAGETLHRLGEERGQGRCRGAGRPRSARGWTISAQRCQQLEDASRLSLPISQVKSQLGKAALQRGQRVDGIARAKRALDVHHDDARIARERARLPVPRGPRAAPNPAPLWSGFCGATSHQT